MDTQDYVYGNRTNEVVNFKPKPPFYSGFIDTRYPDTLWNVTLTILNPQSDNEEELLAFIDRLYLVEKLKFNDLSSLTLEDLEYLNITNAENILESTEGLISQNPTYDSLVDSPNAQEYNKKILQRCAKHLQTMDKLFTVTEEKLYAVPSVDYVVGEKSYASRFVLETLSEMANAVDQMDAKLQELAALDAVIKENTSKLNNWQTKAGRLILLTGLIGAVCFIGNKLRV